MKDLPRTAAQHHHGALAASMMHTVGCWSLVLSQHKAINPAAACTLGCRLLYTLGQNYTSAAQHMQLNISHTLTRRCYATDKLRLSPRMVHAS
jgi:hypothetical protein